MARACEQSYIWTKWIARLLAGEYQREWAGGCGPFVLSEAAIRHRLGQVDDEENRSREKGREGKRKERAAITDPPEGARPATAGPPSGHGTNSP